MSQERNRRRFSISTLMAWIYFLIIITLIYFVLLQVRKCTQTTNELQLEDTPLSIDRIEAIAQLATLSYRQEFVLDSTEHYKNVSDQMKGELDKIFKQGDLKNTVKNHNIDRRLTLISTVSAAIGIDLTKIEQDPRGGDTVIIRSPHPGILQIGIDYRETEIFIEIGKWSDTERKKIELKALTKAKQILSDKKLIDQSRTKYESIIRQTVTSKTALFEYYENL